MQVFRPFIVSVFGLLLTAGCAIRGQGSGNANENGQDNTSDPEVRVDGSLTSATRIGVAEGELEEDTCNGWFPTVAPFTLIVDSALSMRVEVSGDEELRLFILCGQSIFCGEQTDVNTWTLSRFWGTGVCEVFVGTPNEGEERAYTLTFTQN